MNKRLFSVLLILTLCLSMAISVSAASVDCVYDDADLLGYGEASELQDKLARISDTYDAQVVVVTLESTNGQDIEYFVDDVYDGMDFGYGEDRDGVLLLVCINDRKYQIVCNGFVNDAIDEDAIEEICDAIEPDLKDGDYEDAFDEFADQCEYYLDGYINGFPFQFGISLAIALGVGIVVGLVVVLIMKGQLKSVRKQDLAHNYLKSGSMKVRISNDLFLYKTVTRTKKESSSSSRSSGGSSRSKGGGSF